MKEFKSLLLAGLADDDWQWDWTTRGTLRNPQAKVTAKLIAKAEGVWAGSAAISSLIAVSDEIGFPLTARSRVSDGARVKPGTVVMEWSGFARGILTLERPFLNLVSYASGIATRTQRLVAEVERAAKKRKIKSLPRVTATRKTLPGYRDLAVHSVICGGGWSHRTSLSGGVLIKENHIASAGSIREAMSGARGVAPHGLKIEVEVRNESELKDALKFGADVVMLDNFSPAQVAKALKVIESNAQFPVCCEVSGGLNESNISEYVLPGVHVLSVGGLTHSVEALDLSLLVDDGA